MHLDPLNDPSVPVSLSSAWPHSRALNSAVLEPCPLYEHTYIPCGVGDVIHNLKGRCRTFLAPGGKSRGTEETLKPEQHRPRLSIVVGTWTVSEISNRPIGWEPRKPLQGSADSLHCAWLAEALCKLAEASGRGQRLSRRCSPLNG